MIVGIGDTGKRIISDFKTNVFLDLCNAKVFEECLYTISKRLSIPASPNKLNLVIDTTNCNCKHLIFLPIVFRSFGAGPIHIDNYFGTNSDNDGTIMDSMNTNHTSADNAKLTMRLNPTINSDGTLLPKNDIILSDGVAAISQMSSECEENQFFVARKDGKYLIRLSNQEASPTTGAHILFNWMEIPEI